LVVKNEYNKYNYLNKVRNASSGKVYWTAGKMNARGQLEQSDYGNGVHTTREYNSLTGMLSTIKTKKSNGSLIQNWSYTFNAIGNLTQRKDVKRGLTEAFEYDKLNRLVKTKVNDADDVTVSYDDLGNILFKSDVGTYNYDDPGGPKPHAVQTITTVKGNILNTNSQGINYTSFDKIANIAQGTDSLTFIYGLSHERKRVDTYKNKKLTRQKYYVGNLYEKEKDIATGEIKETCYIFAGGTAIAIYNHTSSGAASTCYLHKDHLGSMQCITDESGGCIQELSYDAWGNRRDPGTWEVYSTLPTGILLARGYTGHEHLDLVDLVNMNGRLYDPAIGRFLSPDPIVQDPDNLQSYNRYSYCLNNPLSLTDPSGYSWFSRNWRAITASVVAITVTVVTAGTGTGVGVAIMSGAAGGFAGGVTGAVLSGASLGQTFKAGVVGGVIGGASGFLSFASGGVSAQSTVGAMLERAGKHAFSNAWLNGITGGNMKHGLITGALSSMGNGLINTKLDSRALKVGASAVLGGTIDEIGGGKFANGAITGAYGMLFNEMQHDLKEKKAQSQGETWYYGVQSSGVFDTGHAFAYNPNSGMIYEINHPSANPDDGPGSRGPSSALSGTQSGNVVSIGYKYNMNTREGRESFLNFRGGRPPLVGVPIHVSNPQAATAFFESWVGQSWDYSFLTNNCKHFVGQGLSQGGASIIINSPSPVVWRGRNVHYIGTSLGF
jgi:RHS repeat-associated protein